MQFTLTIYPEFSCHFFYRESLPKRSRRTTLVNDSTDFDAILDHVGGWGMFQWKLLGVLMFSTFMMSYTLYSPILYMYTPDHWCEIPQNYSDILNINPTDLLDLMIPIDENTLKRSQCFMFDPESIGDSIPANKSNWKTVKRMHGQHYNLTGYFKSITTQVNIIHCN